MYGVELSSNDRTVKSREARERTIRQSHKKRKRKLTTFFRGGGASKLAKRKENRLGKKQDHPLMHERDKGSCRDKNVKRLKSKA